MNDTKPSERALAAAEHLDGAFAFYNKANRKAEFAAIIDEHCPAQPGHDELLATCKLVIATVAVWRHGNAWLLIPEHTVKQVSAALAAAKENPNGK
jgi:hypothetical protein